MRKLFIQQSFLIAKIRLLFGYSKRIFRFLCIISHKEICEFLNSIQELLNYNFFSLFSLHFYNMNSFGILIYQLTINIIMSFL